MVAAFVTLFACVLAGGAVVRWDVQMRAWVLAHHLTGLLSASTAVTNVGSPYVSAAVVLGVAVAVSRRRGSPAPLALTALPGPKRTHPAECGSRPFATNS